MEQKQIEIGYPYLYQVYYDCGTNQEVSINTKYDWDLAFEASEDGWHIILNTAKGMLASVTDITDLTSVTTDNGLELRWDSSTGNLDSTAIGDWGFTSGNHVVSIINRQFNANGQALGKVKMVVDSVTDQNYYIRFAALTEQQSTSFVIDKDPEKNFVHFSFENNGAHVNVEPDKENWDLLFTNYQHFFSNLPLPFVITGVHSNIHSGVKVAEDLNGNFFNITLEDTVNYTFSDRLDEIGFDWKIRNGADNSFTIEPNKSFIILSTEGIYYKMRFVDFYDENGNKGYPTFEIQKL